MYYFLARWFITVGKSVPKGAFDNTQRSFGVTTVREGCASATCISRGEVRNFAEQPTKHRTAPPAKNYPAKNVSSSKTEKNSGTYSDREAGLERHEALKLL